MFTVTNKLRPIVAIGAAGAALALGGVASAATVVDPPATGTSVVASQPITVAEQIDGSKVGSAGIDGYDDEECEHLAGLANAAQAKADQALQTEGETQDDPAAHWQAVSDAVTYGQEAADDREQLDDNCLVID